MSRTFLAVAAALVSCGAMTGCSAGTNAPVAAVTAVTRPTPTATPDLTYTLKDGTSVVVAPDEPVPAVVKKDAARRVTPVANKSLRAADGNHAVAAEEVLSARATALSSKLKRPVAIVFRTSSSDGPMWTSLGSGHTDLYGALSASGAKSDAIHVARKWTKWNGGVVIITDQ